jgi:hypothetical protein
MRHGLGPFLAPSVVPVPSADGTSVPRSYFLA